MTHNWMNEEKKYGFYLVGFFDKGKKSEYAIQKEKPFEIDATEGYVSPKCVRAWKRNMWATNWFFIEGYKLGEIKDNSSLRRFINEIWQDWCKKHNRTYKPLLQLSQDKRGRE